MYQEETTLKEEVKFEGKVFTVQRDEIELSGGMKSFREIVLHNGGVCVLTLDKDDNAYFVQQFRYPYKKVIIEVPAGKLEIGEEPFDAMKREQREETGTYSDNYVSLGTMYPTPGYCTEIIHMWASRVSGECDMNLDEGEFLSVTKIHIDKAVEMVLRGEISDAKTQICILKTNHLLKEGKI